MDNISQNQTLCQCLRLIPFDKVDPLSLHTADVGKKKLSTAALVQIFVAAHLQKWNSYAQIEQELRANEELCRLLRIDEISGPQLSRRIVELPTEILVDIFGYLVVQIHLLSQQDKEMEFLNPTIGPLNVVDSTSLTLPQHLCKWAKATKDWTGVKMHTRLAVRGAQLSFPDKIVPSTGNVSDQEGSDHLVEPSEATYVMDRGYGSYERMDSWKGSGIHFVSRIQNNYKATIVKENPVPKQSNITLDAIVMMGSEFRSMKYPIRLVEFVDEENTLYRLLTTREDLSAEEVAHIYRLRWLIETYFRWMKQHLQLKKVFSTKPQGVWNQMFIAMIAQAVTWLVKFLTQTTKSTWDLLSLMRTHAKDTWERFYQALFRKGKRTSKGRQKKTVPKEQDCNLVSTVAIIR